jgi:hypothetical protein
VSSELLEGILTRREPVGAVLRAIREKYGASSPTFFSYLYYGDVTARLVPDEEPAPRAKPPSPATLSASASPPVPPPEPTLSDKGLIL